MKEIKFYQSQLQPRGGSVFQPALIIAAILFALIGFIGGVMIQRSGWLDDLVDKNQKVTTNSGLPEDLNYASVEELYDELRKQYDGELTEQALLDGLKSGLADAAGDAYTVYLNEEQATQFEEDLNGTFSGIGAEIGKENGSLIVVAPLDGFPAQEAGLRAKDKIIAINGEDATGLTIDEAISKIRGEEGTDVKLTIVRGNEQKNFKITRATITVPSVKYEVKGDNIGYIRVTRFAEDTSALIQQAAQDLKSQNVKGMILDLRNNSGGLLSTAVDVSSIWLNGDLVVEQREGEVVTDSIKAATNPILDGIPTIVLINEGSASASEIVAGALKDNGAATLLGQTSFGKGSVQQLEELAGGGVLKVTVARWYTPGGLNIDHTGIKPDTVIKISEKDITAGKDPQLDAALEKLKQ